MPPRRVPLIARVECRSDSRAEERPIAVSIGGRRIGVVDVIDCALVTSAAAGEPVSARFVVELEDGTVVAIERAMPEGDWRCWQLLD